MSIEIKRDDLCINSYATTNKMTGVEVVHIPTGITVRCESEATKSEDTAKAIAELTKILEAGETKMSIEEILRFQTKADIWRYLLDGDSIRHKKTGEIAKLVNGHTRFSFDTPSNWEPVAEPKPWYESIPENGWLCWVSDKSENDRLTWARVTGYFNIDEYAYKSDRGGFKYATPVKLEEIQEYIYKPEQPN